jgi:hypothetical protein
LKLKEKIKEEFTVFIKTKSNTMRTSGTVDQEVKEYQDAVIEDVRKHLQIDVTLD